MTYTLRTAVTETALSNRSKNALMKQGIDTLHRLLDLHPSEIDGIAGLGAKSKQEIQDFVTGIRSGQITVGGYFPALMQFFTCDEGPTFLHTDGKTYRDLFLKEMNLKARAFNCLQAAGITRLSELLLLSENDLMQLPSMGATSVKHIFERIEEIGLQEVLPHPESLAAKLILSISEQQAFEGVLTAPEIEISVMQLNDFLVKNGELQPVEDYLENASCLSEFQSTPVGKAILRAEVKKRFTDGAGTRSVDELVVQMPTCLRNEEAVREACRELETEGILEGAEGNPDCLILRLPDFLGAVRSNLEGRDRDILIRRNAGESLESIGEEYEISRERVRQVESKAWERLLSSVSRFREDRWKELYENYEMGVEEFRKVFGSEGIYHYLHARYPLPKGKRRRPIPEALEEERLPAELRRKLEVLACENYVKIGKEYIPATRAALIGYTLRHFCEEDTSTETFEIIFREVMKEAGKEDDIGVGLLDRGFFDRLSDRMDVLWKYGKRFRYYPISSNEYDALFSQLRLNDFQDIEISAAKLYREYPETMKEYDIRDEYELHNLLKKICKPEEFPTLGIKRMPILEFGTADRNRQVRELLEHLTPISAENLAEAYEELYGVQKATFLANFVDCIKEYFDHGIYRVAVSELTPEETDALHSVLKEDFLMREQLKELMIRNGLQEILPRLTTYVLKKAGYHVYGGYLISNRYDSAADYHRQILLRKQPVDMRTLPEGLISLSSFQSALLQLRQERKIVEVEPGIYRSQESLQEEGLQEEWRDEYVRRVEEMVEEGMYFTVQSLQHSGMAVREGLAAFGEWFLSSVLAEEHERFTCRRFGNNRIFRSGKHPVTGVSFLEWLVYQAPGMYLNLDELEHILHEDYKVMTGNCKVREIIAQSGLYFDPIGQCVYADYEIFQESGIKEGNNSEV